MTDVMDSILHTDHLAAGVAIMCDMLFNANPFVYDGTLFTTILHVLPESLMINSLIDIQFQ